MIRSTATDPLDDLDAARAATVARIADLVRVRTYDRVKNLSVTFAPDTGVVRLSGEVHTYYVKQLAQHAAIEVLRGETLYNAIEVK
jgi:hypothetical protein